MEREKHLILEGKMAVEEAPEELANHPVFKITQMTNKILDEKRQKVCCHPTYTVFTIIGLFKDT